MKVIYWVVAAIACFVSPTLCARQGLPQGKGCSDSKVNTPVITEVKVKSGKISVKFHIIPVDGGVNPEYVAIVLGEDNLLPGRYAAVIGKQNSGANQTVAYELSDLGKDKDGYSLSDIPFSSPNPVSVSLFGYICNSSEGKYVSSMSAAHKNGLLWRFAGESEKIVGSFYGLSNTGEVGKFNSLSIPAVANTVNGIVTFPSGSCKTGCRLVTNLRLNDTVVIDPGKIEYSFPSSEESYQKMYSGVTADSSTVIIGNATENRIYVFLQRRYSGVHDVTLELLGGSKSDVGGGVKVPESVGYSTTVLGNRSLEDAVYHISQGVLGKTISIGDISTIDYLRAKMFAFITLRSNAAIVSDLADNASYVVRGIDAAPSSLYKRMQNVWGASLDANTNPDKIRPIGFAAVNEWDAPLAFGVYTRLGFFEIDATAGDPLSPSSETFEIKYTDNIELFRRDVNGKFIPIGESAVDCNGNKSLGGCETDKSWTISPSLGLGFAILTGKKGLPEWKEVYKYGLWARPKDGLGAKAIREGDAKYQIRFRHGSVVKEDLFVGEISDKPFVDIPNSLLSTSSGSAEWLSMMPFESRFRISSDVETAYPMNRNGFDIKDLSSDLTCLSGCNDAVSVKAGDGDVVVSKSSLSSVAKADYRYSLDCIKNKKRTAKFVADMPFQLFPYHDYVISGYGSPSDRANMNQEGLAVLYYRQKASEGAAPELIRIRRYYGSALRMIKIDADNPAFEGAGTSYYELDKFLFADKKVRELTFFGHGDAMGTALGNMTYGGGRILRFHYGIPPVKTYNSTIPFSGTFVSDAKVNLYQCLGATFYDPREERGDVKLFDHRYVPYSDKLESDPGVVKPIAARLAKSWNVPVAGFDWVGSATTPDFTTSPFKGYAWGLSSVAEGNYEQATGIPFHENGEPDWNGNRVAAQLSLYSPDGKRSKVLLPEYLKLGGRAELPSKMTLECLRGGSCSP